MAPHLSLAILLAIACASSDAYLTLFSNGRPRNGFLGELISQRVSVEDQKRARDEAKVGWFDQKVDHFNSADSRRWKQKYMTAGADHPKALFVSIGGEGPADAFWVTGAAMSYYAKNYDAVCLELEHRYYGDSHPVANTSTENLRFLSSEQYLADLAEFITAMKEEYSVEKVIVFGGSYSGALAAWFRIKYPHLAQGAVANSAPLVARVNFRGYFQVVSDSLNTYKSGNVCTTAISAAVKKMQSLMESADGRAKLKDMFNLCEDIDINKKLDIYNLYSSLADNFGGAVQYNSGNHGIEKVCSIMTDTSVGEPIERYAKVSKTKQNDCRAFAYDGVVKGRKVITWDGSDRQWTYQTCTEFGYYATSDSDKQPFGHTFPVELGTQMCRDVYGPEFNAGNISRAVSETNIYYGGLDYTQDRVVFVNGEIDPWHYLSILQSLPNAPAIYIPGESHCANMYAPSASDSPGIAKAHDEINKLIGQWLE